MLDWKELVHLPDEELARLDVAEVNLACATGLPGSEKIDVDLCLWTLDLWAEEVRAYMGNSFAAFHRNPGHWDHSWALCRFHGMIRLLHRRRVRYNPAKIPAAAAFFPEDTFIYGIMQGDGGTCASLPVIYAATGRRLGWPLKLVKAPCHFFVRWEEGELERHNLEVNNNGFNNPNDDYFRTRYNITPFIEEKGCYLQSLTPRQELANFLVERACHFRDAGQHRQAVNALAWASALYPENFIFRNTLIIDINKWGESLEALEPPGFPAMQVNEWAQRRFPTSLPEEIEKDIRILEATENLLKTPDLIRRWWEPLRRGVIVPGRPSHALIQMKAEGCNIQLEFLTTESFASWALFPEGSLMP